MAIDLTIKKNEDFGKYALSLDLKFRFNRIQKHLDHLQESSSLFDNPTWTIFYYAIKSLSFLFMDNLEKKDNLLNDNLYEKMLTILKCKTLDSIDKLFLESSIFRFLYSSSFFDENFHHLIKISFSILELYESKKILMEPEIFFKLLIFYWQSL